MTPHDERVEVLDEHRPVLVRLARETPRRGSISALSGYVLGLREPTGYLIAAGLQQRDAKLDPEGALRASLMSDESSPFLVGVVPRSALIDILGPLAPVTQPLAAELKKSIRREGMRVLVAAGGGAELFTLDDLSSG
ncbi:hypothetical protein SOCE26_076270 [Sorangium cellulosum]|uniref:Uncharacterized protein n=1 Tax=Sorangium cellulosum TaxID=56 RepID=A0A2L0F3I5_SORCE|nr:hypothetical protein [Sorangium cellulosum]AUX46122.1 hypothetical protein SOCE26_076270 [Sorangium cellulosum]